MYGLITLFGVINDINNLRKLIEYNIPKKFIMSRTIVIQSNFGIRFIKFTRIIRIKYIFKIIIILTFEKKYCFKKSIFKL
ncbi:hypothetical protein Hokovirus_1_324 [Hokovirus HKV1]|uniref:Uncharacterized protein n=1 Tax=Hokovirus HKV1 TaxID=1977638 RepID=A0A1V0SFF0_9VIRU|nr:hypothetical protein Hokovirus_1_324 [Hokovirus HKV1]